MSRYAIRKRTVPLSRARRELNSIIRKLARDQMDVYCVTRNGKPYVYLMRVGLYESLQAEAEALAEVSEQRRIGHGNEEDTR